MPHSLRSFATPKGVLQREHTVHYVIPKGIRFAMAGKGKISPFGRNDKREEGRWRYDRHGGDCFAALTTPKGVLQREHTVHYAIPKGIRFAMTGKGKISPYGRNDKIIGRN